MLRKMHFISGLPRSGSTLLCAILKQNPAFSAAVTSPVVSLINALMPKMSEAKEFSVFFDEARKEMILKGLMSSYYGHLPLEETIFDTNRTWTGKVALLNQLYPQARIICCVRDIAWIIDSIERMLRKNPLQLSRMFNFQSGCSIYARIESLMNSDNGLVGTAWSCLREAWFSEFAKNLVVINYDKLVSEPQMVITRLYEELREPIFQHDFNDVTYDVPDYDAVLGMPGLHTVRKKVEQIKRQPCIPPDIFAKYADSSFWLKPDMNRRGVTIL